MSDSESSRNAGGGAWSEARAYEHAPAGMLSLGPDGRIFGANATIARWLGVSAESLLGRPFRDLLTLPGRIFYETNFAPGIRLEGGVEEITLDFVLAGGETLPGLVNAVMVEGSADQPDLMHVAVMRARGRRAYERDLRSREAVAAKGLNDAQEMAELREQFIAVLGHDLRNPLASIVGAARLLRRELPSEKASRVLDMMDGSVDRMAGLIDDVMDFARGRLGSGIQVDLRTEPLEPVLLQVVEEFEASQPGRTILTDFNLGAPVSFDRSRLAQLVSNLLGNALTHGDARAPVRLQAAILSERLALSVSNAGDPIPPAAMARLFQPFVRGQVRPNQEGLGLGLHIASEIARAHGGTLVVTSTAIETRFVLDMPAHSPVSLTCAN